MLNKLTAVILLFTSFSLLAQTEPRNSFSEGDWEAANCPGALPADKPPYIDLMEYYSNMGEDAKFDMAVAKHYRYSQCVTAITTRRGHPTAAFDAYQSSMEMGDVEFAEEEFSLEATLAKAKEAYDIRGPIYPVLEELYERAYSQEMSDMVKADSDGARELLTREYLCDCLTRPLEEFDIPGYPSNTEN